MRWKNTGCYLEFTEISSPPPLVGRKFAEAERCRGLESNAAPRLGDAGRIRRSGGSSSPKILSRIFRGSVTTSTSIREFPETGRWPVPVTFASAYLLKIVEADKAPSVELKRKLMVLRVRPGADKATSQAIIEAWYRHRLREAADLLIAKWEPTLNVRVNRLFVQRMKTKWGSCNPASRNIRLNTELAKKAAGLPGIHPRARNAPPAGADAQRVVHLADGSVHAEVAVSSGGVEQAAGEAGRLGVLRFAASLPADAATKHRNGFPRPAASPRACPFACHHADARLDKMPGARKRQVLSARRRL